MRFKARLVAQGYTQRHGLDYDETFSPVVRNETVRAVIALAAKHNLILHQMDVKTAFLNGELQEEVYMRQPEGFEVGDGHLICKLRKSIYGLKQSSRCWNKKLNESLCKLNFVQSTSDPCLYVSQEGMAFIAIHVDDLIIAADSDDHMDRIKRAIAGVFEMKDLGKLEYVLGVHVIQRDDCVWVNQAGYTHKVLEKFQMDNAKPVSTPADPGEKLTKDDDSEPFSTELYQSAVGCLLFLSTWTRPDIAYAVGNVARFCSKPTKRHWVAVKRIMRYLCGTVNYGLCYDRGNQDECTGYSDADWGGDIDTRKSTSGYVYKLAGAAISWKSKKQASVAISTAEAEYMALASATQEGVWLQKILEDFGEPTVPIVIHEDNQAAIAMTKNPQYHGRAKHVSIKYHFVRDLVEQNKVKMVYCPSEDMIADILTKGLNKDKFVYMRALTGMGMCPI